ncbi:hypothetical protein [Janthinobacterium sp. DSP2-3-3]|uniref:hypothetical protein n=1 Tax=Janthinobacterium sp. DSP2-3-3 TaxID=2804596 RepID=UPI003CF2C144
MELKDVEISKEIRQCLYNIAPEDAKIILMIVVLSPEGDVGRFEFYSNNGVAESQFSISDLDMEKLLDLVGEHQQFMVSNNQPAWTRCEFTVNVDAGKFSMELAYKEDVFREGSLR